MKKWFSAIVKKLDIDGMDVFIISSFVILIAVIVAISAISDSYREKGFRSWASEKVYSVTDWIGETWNHGKCLVSICDRDGRCPVWLSDESRCAMRKE